MTQDRPVNPLELDQAQAAKKIAEAGIADESAAYVNADDGDAPADDATTADAEAHPS